MGQLTATRGRALCSAPSGALRFTARGRSGPISLFIEAPAMVDVAVVDYASGVTIAVRTLPRRHQRQEISWPRR